ncbi:hypothetical protein DKX38_019374 [Salix brachista]|uniref:Uncharacterized protein n=1 Tax=Salix brachista TaxID=2182728 RepID=A0A5N5KG29_9ROSI|nr:hypothetical protein DKX38_019374 [Salix brachista]
MFDCCMAMLRPYVGNVVKMCQHDSSRGKLLDNRRVVICSVDVIFGLSFVLVFSMVVCDLQTGLGVIIVGTIYVSAYSKQCPVVRFGTQKRYESGVDLKRALMILYVVDFRTSVLGIHPVIATDFVEFSSIGLRDESQSKLPKSLR